MANQEDSSIKEITTDIVTWNKLTSDYNVEGSITFNCMIKDNYKIEGLIKIQDKTSRFDHTYLIVYDRNRKCEKTDVVCTKCGEIFRKSKSSNWNIQRHIKRTHPEFLIHDIPEERTDQSIFANALCYILLKNKPFKDIDDINFRYLMNVKLDKQINMQSILDDIIIRLDAKIVEDLKNFNYLACTADEWSDSRKRRYMGIIVHGFNEDLDKYQTYTLAHVPLTSDHATAGYLSEKILETLTKFEIREKVVLLTTDTNTTIQDAVARTKIPWMPCFIHLMNLILKKFFEKIPCYSAMKDLAASLSNSTVFVAYNIKNPIKLNDGKTSKRTNFRTFTEIRWSSFFNLIEDLQFFKNQILKFNKAQTEKQRRVFEFDMHIFSVCQKLNTLALDIKDINRILQSENLNPIGYVLYIFQILKNSISELDATFDDAKNAFNEAYDLYWNKHNKYFEIPLGICLMLNPYTKFEEATGDKQYETNVKREITRQLNRMAPPVPLANEMTPASNGGRIWNSIFRDQTHENEFELWIRSTKPNVPISMISYWKSHSVEFPNLAKLALKYLIMQPTSASAERLFSKSKRILRKDRLRLLTENVEILAKIQGNKDLSRVIIIQTKLP